MSRVLESLLNGRAFSNGATQPMLDIVNGGQHAWAPDYSQWISNQAYVRNNLVAILLEAPRFFSLMPEPNKWFESLKAIVELHARTIEGLTSGLKAEFDEHPVGGAGEMQQEVIDMKRDRSEPTMTFIDKVGLPIQTFFTYWMQYGMMDPDTKYPLIATLQGQKPDDMLADWNTMSCLFFEPDRSHKKIVKSWVCTNMMPKENGEVIGKRDLTTAGEILTLSIPFTAITQSGLGTNVFAQRILDSINMAGANPLLRPSFIQEISSDVAAATTGYNSSVTNLGNSAVPGIR